jgi:hypothetical protein
MLATFHRDSARVEDSVRLGREHLAGVVGSSSPEAINWRIVCRVRRLRRAEKRPGRSGLVLLTCFVRTDSLTLLLTQTFRLMLATFHRDSARVEVVRQRGAPDPAERSLRRAPNRDGKWRASVGKFASGGARSTPVRWKAKRLALRTCKFAENENVRSA